MTWHNKRVLVTGAGGFIGSHLTERLVSLGAETTAMVHYNALGARGWLSASTESEKLKIVAGDITDREFMRGVMDGVDVVFHLAAMIAIPYSYVAPTSFVNANVGGTLCALNVARELGVGRIVHTSTSEVYGSAESVPMSETHRLCAQSPYAASKIGADKLVESYHLSFDLPVVTVRPFNTFGPRQSNRAVIPTIISQALSGSALKIGSLSPTRDFNYVANTVDGFIQAGCVEGVEGETFNLGTGQEASIGDLIALVGDILEKPLDIVQEGQRIRPEASEVDRLLADASHAQRLLGWKPNVDLAQGLRTTVDWFRDNAEKYTRPGYTI